MGLFAFLIFAVVVVFVVYLATLAIDYFAPSHPAIVDKILWGLCIFIIVYQLVVATGLLSHDVAIPHI